LSEISLCGAFAVFVDSNIFLFVTDTLSVAWRKTVTDEASVTNRRRTVVSP